MKVNEKSDVYSFGVVLLELITGKRPNDPSFGDNKDIVKWVTETTMLSERDDDSEKECHFANTDQIVDKKMKPTTSDVEEIEKVLKVAFSCTSAFPINRPSMRKVVELLNDVRKLAKSK